MMDVLGDHTAEGWGSLGGWSSADEVELASSEASARGSGNRLAEIPGT